MNKILVVEDNIITGKHIASILIKAGFEVKDICGTPEKAMSSLAGKKPDLIILDINLGAAFDGIQLASVIKLDFGIPFVFLTSYNDEKTINRMLAVNPVGYVAKPYNPIDLIEMISKALSAPRSAEKIMPTKPAEEYLFIKNNRQAEKVKISEIDFIESDGRYTYVYFNGQKRISNTSLKALKEKLMDHRFIQCHKSYIINLKRIDSFTSESIRFGSNEIPISKNYKDEFMKQIDIV